MYFVRTDPRDRWGPEAVSAVCGEAELKGVTVCGLCILQSAVELASLSAPHTSRRPHLTLSVPPVQGAD
jgi:hypothetical protein